MVDSGHGKTLIGRDTLQQLESLVAKCGFGPIKLRDENNVFRFGNGMTEKSSQVAGPSRRHRQSQSVWNHRCSSDSGTSSFAVG